MAPAPEASAVEIWVWADCQYRKPPSTARSPTPAKIKIGFFFDPDGLLLTSSTRSSLGKCRHSGESRNPGFFELPGSRIESGMTKKNKYLKAAFDFISILSCHLSWPPTQKGQTTKNIY